MREGNLPSVEERGCRKSKGTDEVNAIGRGQSSEMEGDFLFCEVEGHPKDTEEEQRPVSQATAPPQKRRAAIRKPEFIAAFQVVQWNHHTSTPHRAETNGVGERAFHRVKRETAVAPVPSGLPAE